MILIVIGGRKCVVDVVCADAIADVAAVAVVAAAVAVAAA